MTEAQVKIFLGLGFGKISTEVEFDDFLFRVHDIIVLCFRINVIRIEKIR